MNRSRVMMAATTMAVWCVAASCWGQEAAKDAKSTPEEKPLPEGDTGIASRYMFDNGIEQDRRVVFMDGFESGVGGRWDGTWKNGGRVEATQQAGCFYMGRNAALMALMRANLDKEDSIGMRKYLKPGFDVVFMRYYAKFDKNSEFFHGGGHNGACMDALSPGWPDATPGQKADGKNKFTVLLDTYREARETPSPGPQAFYVYYPEQRQNFGEQWFPTGRTQPGERGRTPFGPTFVSRPDFIPEGGRWYCYEFMVKANTAGKRDGRMAFWVDGKLMADFPGLRLRDVDSLKINRIGIQMSSLNKNITKPVAMWVDEVVAATSYIGPVFTGKKTSEDKGKGTEGIVPPPGWGTTPAPKNGGQ